MRDYPNYLNITGDTIGILVTPEQWNNMSKKEIARVRQVVKKVFVNARKELKQQLPEFEID